MRSCGHGWTSQGLGASKLAVFVAAVGGVVSERSVGNKVIVIRALNVLDLWHQLADAAVDVVTNRPRRESRRQVATRLISTVAEVLCGSVVTFGALGTS